MIKAILAVLLVANVAHAGCFEMDGSGSDCHIGVIGGGALILAAAFASCAPEVKEGNIAATDRTLTDLAASPKFAQAAKFKAIIRDIKTEPKPEAKILRYFNMVGINARNQQDVVEFMGQRDVRSSQLNALEKKAELTPEQSMAVVQALTQSLRGSLN